ncbi:hypothetical protein VTP01DRAFT_241 [Rhizomucor pusillus]|uniref:uncharacterized protein n=1 Tax=Rhizomucor pusillus TaxID=4840 RepID=UPI003742736C
MNNSCLCLFCFDDWESAADAGLIDYTAPVKKEKAKKTLVDLESEYKRIWEEANRYSTPTVVRIDSIARNTNLRSRYLSE